MLQCRAEQSWDKWMAAQGCEMCNTHRSHLSLGLFVWRCCCWFQKDFLFPHNRMNKAKFNEMPPLVTSSSLSSPSSSFTYSNCVLSEGDVKTEQSHYDLIIRLEKCIFALFVWCHKLDAAWTKQHHFPRHHLAFYWNHIFQSQVLIFFSFIFFPVFCSSDLCTFFSVSLTRFSILLVLLFHISLLWCTSITSSFILHNPTHRDTMRKSQMKRKILEIEAI